MEPNIIVLSLNIFFFCLFVWYLHTKNIERKVRLKKESFLDAISWQFFRSMRSCRNYEFSLNFHINDSFFFFFFFNWTTCFHHSHNYKFYEKKDDSTKRLSIKKKHRLSFNFHFQIYSIKYEFKKFAFAIFFQNVIFIYFYIIFFLLYVE